MIVTVVQVGGKYVRFTVELYVEREDGYDISGYRPVGRAVRLPVFGQVFFDDAFERALDLLEREYVFVVPSAGCDDAGIFVFDNGVVAVFIVAGDL